MKELNINTENKESLDNIEKDLEVIFSIARNYFSSDRKQLIEVLSLQDKVIELIKK
jgi:hypothetical protein